MFVNPFIEIPVNIDVAASFITSVKLNSVPIQSEFNPFSTIEDTAAEATIEATPVPGIKEDKKPEAPAIATFLQSMVCKVAPSNTT